MRCCVAFTAVLFNLLSPACSFAQEMALPSYDFEKACANYAASPTVAIIAKPKIDQGSSQGDDPKTLQQKFEKDCADRNKEARLSLVLIIDRIDEKMNLKCDGIAQFHLPYYYVSFFDCVHHALKMIDRAKKHKS